MSPFSQPVAMSWVDHRAASSTHTQEAPTKRVVEDVPKPTQPVTEDFNLMDRNILLYLDLVKTMLCLTRLVASLDRVFTNSSRMFDVLELISVSESEN